MIEVSKLLNLFQKKKDIKFLNMSIIQMKKLFLCLKMSIKEDKFIEKYF